MLDILGRRLHVYYVYELKGETTKKKNPKTEGYTPHKHRVKKWLFTLLWINLIGQNGPQYESFS